MLRVGTQYIYEIFIEYIVVVYQNVGLLCVQINSEQFIAQGTFKRDLHFKVIFLGMIVFIEYYNILKLLETIVLQRTTKADTLLI